MKNTTSNSCFGTFEIEEMRPRNGWIYTLITCYFFSHLTCLTNKHWHQLEPVHRFELNALLDYCLLMMSQAIQQNEQYLNCHFGLKIFCLVNQILQKWSNFCLFADIILCQVDRFLALYWNAEYKERLEDNTSKIVIGVIKLVIAVLAFGCVLFDPSSFSCTPDVRFACHYFVKKALFYRAIPMLMSLLTIVGVSLYVLSVVLKHQRTVAPVINNNPVAPHIPTVSAAVEQDMHVEDIEEGEEEKEEDKVVVKRNNSNPHLFIRVTREKVGRIKKNISIPCPSKIFLEKTKVIMKSSLMTLCLISTMIPQNLVVVYVFVTEAKCLNDPMLLTYGNIGGFISLTNLILYPLLVRRKLNHF